MLRDSWKSAAATLAALVFICGLVIGCGGSEGGLDNEKEDAILNSEMNARGDLSQLEGEAQAAAKALKAAGAQVMAQGTEVIMIDFNGKGTDALLAEVGKLGSVRGVMCSGSKGVTDAGLESIAGLKGVGMIDLNGTGVTAGGVAKLKAAQPAAQIMHPSQSGAQKAGAFGGGASGKGPGGGGGGRDGGRGGGRGGGR